jgi:DNA-binding LytR/AlgR family response regulator
MASALLRALDMTPADPSSKSADVSEARTAEDRPLRVLIVDDEPLALERLGLMLRDHSGVEVVGEATDGDDAAAKVTALRPDLVLLDIRMPSRDGISLARSLAETPEVGVVFVTAFDDFAVQAFEVDAVDYLLKPVGSDRLGMALARAKRHAERARAGARDVGVEMGSAVCPESPAAEYASCLWVQKRHGMVRVDVSAIDWIEAARDYVLLHTATNSYILRVTMDGLARKLDPSVMLRVSRSAFVRRDAVVSIERQGRAGLILVLADKAAVRVGTTFVKTVEHQLRHAPTL